MFKPIRKILSPAELKEKVPLKDSLKQLKEKRDEEIKSIIAGRDKRKIIIVGPCSADDESAVFLYCEKLASLNEKVRDKLYLVPRVFSNKPRTRGGYKGLLFTPVAGDTEIDINNCLARIRKLHIGIMERSSFTGADELLYPTLYGYTDDLISYYTIGARSSENQTHRIIASGIDEVVGIKNPTSGNIKAALGAINMAQHQNEFYYRGNQVKTDGNAYTHLVLRGAVNYKEESIPNYKKDNLLEIKEEYEKENLLNPAIIVDTNHANSGKNFELQPSIAKDVFKSMKENEGLFNMVKGLLIESYLLDGTSENGIKEFGKSITDGCLGWEKTERLILNLAELV